MNDRSKYRACPCLHTIPCHAMCTCVVPVSSKGCKRCCSYGSTEQQRKAAERIAAILDDHPAEQAFKA